MFQVKTPIKTDRTHYKQLARATYEDTRWNIMRIWLNEGQRSYIFLQDKVNNRSVSFTMDNNTGEWVMCGSFSKEVESMINDYNSYYVRSRKKGKLSESASGILCDTETKTSS